MVKPGSQPGNAKKQTASRKRESVSRVLTGNTVQIVLFSVLIVCLGATSFERNFVWDTKLSLWSDVASKSRLKSRAHNNLGNCYALLNRTFDAIGEYKIAVSLDRNNIEAYYNLGMFLEDVGILNQAVYYYNIFCKTAPRGYAEQTRKSCERVDALSRRLQSRPGDAPR